MSSRRRVRLLLLILSISLYSLAWTLFSVVVMRTPKSAAPAHLPTEAFTVITITPHNKTTTPVSASVRKPTVPSKNVENSRSNVEKSKLVKKSKSKVERLKPNHQKTTPKTKDKAAAEPKDKDYAPKSKDEEHTPTHKDEKHAPKPKDEEHAPKLKDEDHAPKPKDEKHAPKPKDEKYAPKPKGEKHVQKSKDEEHVPKPKNEENAPKPKEGKQLPKSKDEEHAPKPKDENHAPKLQDEEHAPKPKDEKHASKPKDEEHAPKSKDEKRAPKPKGEEYAPKPKDEKHAPKSKDDKRAPKPKDEKHAPKLKDEKHAPKSKDEKHVPKPKDEKHAPKLKDEEHATKSKDLKGQNQRRVRARRKIVRMPYQLTRIRSKAQAVTILISDLDKFNKKKTMKIPRIIHQIYRDERIPDVYAPYIQSWVKNNPDWEYWFWDDTSGPKFVRKHYPEFAPLYDAYCHDLMRSDALRYFILYKYGGIYADADYECYRSMEAKLNSSQCYLVQENWAQAQLLYNTDLLVQNSFMASAPGHPFMNFVINNLPAAAPVKDCHLHTVLSATGPLLLDRCRKTYQQTCKSKPCQIQILPSDIMMPEFDTAKGRPKYYRHKCGTRHRLSKLDPGGKKACKYFKDHLYGPPLIGPEVYASHKFLHIGNEAHRYKAKSYSNITKLVPEVFFPVH